MNHTSIEFKNEAQRIEFQNGIKSINTHLQDIADGREVIKDIIDDLYTAIGIEKPLIRKVAKLYFAQNAQEFKEANETVSSLYNEVAKTSSVANQA